MNILVLSPKLFPIRGGAGVYTVELARRMPHEFQIHILTERRKNRHEVDDKTRQLEDLLSEHNVVFHFLDSVLEGRYASAIAFQAIVAANIRRLITANQIDIVHTNSEMPDFLIRPSRIGVPIVSTTHSTIQLHFESLRSSGVKASEMSKEERAVLRLGDAFRSIERLYYSNGRHFIAVSEWTKRHLMADKGIRDNKIDVIHNGVDTSQFQSSRKKDASLLFPRLHDLGQPKILFFSRIAAIKGVRQLLQAIPRVCAATDAHFIIAGQGELPRHGIPEENLTFLGLVPHDLAPSLYATSDIFVLPSLSENLPISVLEAMASECGVVVSDVGGISEIVTNGEDGILVRPNNVDDLAASLISVICDDSKRRELGKSARRTAVERFQWKKAVFKTAECYQRIGRQSPERRAS